MTTRALTAPSTPQAGVAKPNQLPIATNGRVIATANASNDERVKAGCARLAQNGPLVRMMKTTRIWVAIDSRNQVVRNSSGVDWKTVSRSAKVKRSKTEERGPMM